MNAPALPAQPAGAPARYAVIGHPVAHSRSPAIHALFAAQTAQAIEYGRLWAPLDGFAEAVARFRAEGGAGLNVTVPFKREALAVADTLAPRARAAGAVNTLRFDRRAALGDNTDGVGLLRDIEQRLGQRLGGARVLLLGAGGAARGVVQPLLDAGAERLVVANRTESNARALVEAFGHARLAACALDATLAGERFDVVLNATSAGLSDAAPPVPATLLGTARLAYDLVYGARPTAFMRAARDAGCALACDGLGMLVEQAAESFALWRGVRPHTAPVHAAMRAALDAEASDAGAAPPA